jgi:hypothetical protein
MLPLSELERLAERFLRDRDQRQLGPRAAAVRDTLARGRRALAQADAIVEDDRHALCERLEIACTFVGTNIGDAIQQLPRGATTRLPVWR